MWAKSLVFGLKVCFIATKHWEGWHPSQERGKMYDTDNRQIPNGRLILCFLRSCMCPLEAFWVHFCALWTGVCTVPSLHWFLREVSEERKRMTGRGFFFFYWSLKHVTFGCSPKTMILVLVQSCCVTWERLFYLIQKQHLWFECSHQSVSLKVCCNIFNSFLWNAEFHILKFVLFLLKKWLGQLSYVGIRAQFPA